MSERHARGVMSDIQNAVARLASERPDWLPVLQAACVVARRSEPHGGRFAGGWVLAEFAQQTGMRQWRPGLRRLVAYGLFEKAGESTRGGSRAYYRMPDRKEVERVYAKVVYG